MRSALFGMFLALVITACVAPPSNYTAVPISTAITPPNSPATSPTQDKSPASTASAGSALTRLAGLPIREAPSCDPATPSITPDFVLDGRVLMHAWPETSSISELPELWQISGDTLKVERVGAYTTPTGLPPGPTTWLSPNGQWILATTTWDPREQLPPSAMLIATDLSLVSIVTWDQAWDITLGWWDNERIVILPASGKTTDIFLLDVFTGRASPLPGAQNAVNRSYGMALWSPWREKDNSVVFFNHTLSQALYFDANLSLVLSDLSESTPAWSFGGPESFWSYIGGLVKWSTDDRYAAFTAWTGRVQDVYLIDGLNRPIQITDFAETGAQEVWAAVLGWSPTTPKLLFSTRLITADSTESQLFILDLQAGEIRRLCVDDGAKSLHWSPDGGYVVYTSTDETIDPVSPITVIDAIAGQKWLVGYGRGSIIGWAP